MKQIKELMQLKKEILACDKCRLNKLRGFGWGNIKSEIMFVAQNPGRRPADCTDKHLDVVPFAFDKPVEEKKNSGIYMFELLQYLGLGLNDFYLTNVIKCPREDSNDAPKKWEIINCRPILEKEIEIQKPKAIIGLGSSAKDSLNLIKYGNPVTENNTLKVAIWHPGYVNRNFGKNKQEWFNQASEVKKIVKSIKNLQAT